MKLHLQQINQARDEVLRAANLDWIEIDYKEGCFYMGDIMKQFFKTESGCITIEDAYDFLDEDGKEKTKKYRDLFRNGTINRILLHICEDIFRNADIEVNITKAVDNDKEHYLQGYVRILKHNDMLGFPLGDDLAMKEVQDYYINGRDIAFLSNMGHELRTPLNSIVGFSRLSADEEDPTVRKEYLQIIEENNETLLQLINDILDLSKIESDTLDFHISSFNLNHLISDVVLGAKLRVKSGVAIELNLPEQQYDMNTDKRRLQQIINNFINNAIKFTNHGTITIGMEYRSDNYYIYVKDTGVGIPKDSQKDIFNRFVRLNNQIAGNGLGLSICSSIIERLGGSIGVESEEGKGSNFWILLPNADLDVKSSEVESTPEQNRNHDNSKRIKILIAEDDPSNYRLCEVLLKKNYTLSHAWNGEEAVELFKNDKPDIILMDINMPKMNGYQATTKIRELSWTVPIIALTAYALADDEEKIMQSGFDAYLSKPIDNGKLDEIMRQLTK